MINKKIEIIVRKYQNEPLDNFLIAKIELFLPKNHIKIGVEYKVISTKSTAIITDLITEKQAIKIILIHGSIEQKSGLPTNENFKNLLATKKFSSNDLVKFLQKTGDKNPIHAGENPIVPALVILETILNLLLKTPQYFSIKLINPLFLQNDLNLFQLTDSELIGMSNNCQIFHFKEINS